jgi:hypothetical protein
MEWEFAGETKVLGENLPQFHFVHHKSHLTWDWTQAAEVRSQWLTTWAMAWTPTVQHYIFEDSGLTISLKEQSSPLQYHAITKIWKQGFSNVPEELQNIAGQQFHWTAMLQPLMLHTTSHD